MTKKKLNSDIIKKYIGDNLRKIDEDLKVLNLKIDMENSKVEVLRNLQREYEFDLIQYEDLNSDLKEIRFDIGEMKIWILPDDYRIRAKTYSQGKEFWVHLGKRDKYKSKSNKQLKTYKPIIDRANRELKDVIERYYKDTIVSKRINVQTRLDGKYKDDMERPIVEDSEYFSKKIKYDLPLIRDKINKLIEDPQDFSPTQFRIELKNLVGTIEKDMIRLKSEIEKVKLKIRDIKIDIRDKLRIPVKEKEKNRNRFLKDIIFINRLDEKVWVTTIKGSVIGGAQIRGQKLRVRLGTVEKLKNFSDSDRKQIALEKIESKLVKDYLHFIK